ncbi:MAG: DNA repair protein [Spirochaetales bacterium]|nr:DNA repair protein [Spirochaetales bacterium]
MNKLVPLIYNKLLNKYGSQGWWPVYSLRNTEGRDNRGYLIRSVSIDPGRDLAPGELSKFEIAIGAVLTQNTAWTNVEKALSNLIDLNLMDTKIISDIDQKELANVIRPSGYYNQKAKKIKILTRFLLDGDYLKDGNIPHRTDFLNLWGIGEETADSILLYGYNFPVFVVDAYTKRIFTRIGILEGSENYEEISRIFTDNLEKDSVIFQEYHALIVRHAKEFCKKKALCERCVSKPFCLGTVN